MHHKTSVVWLASLLALATTLDPLSAQTVQPRAPSARELAKYDKNKNGTLEADELAAMRADEAKIVQSVGAAPQSTTAGPVVEMSPFEVTEDKRGYYGATTMSGTRLNSKIEDLASSITVVTKEQMADFAMLNIHDIFNYEANTEGMGNYSDIANNASVGLHHPTDRLMRDPNIANRVRGIGPANISFGNFESGGRVPVDPINIDSIEIARGPNSNIFGIGNASGTVNMQPANAKLDRDSAQAVARTDNWGGYRSSLDVNRVLKKGVLAARGSVVSQHDEWVRRPTGYETLRLNGMLTYRPFEKTTVRGSYLYYNAWGNRPNFTPLRESVTYWRSQGSPTWDPIAQVIHVSGQSIPVNPGQSPSATAVLTASGGLLTSLQRFNPTPNDLPTMFIDRPSPGFPNAIRYFISNKLSTDDTPYGVNPATLSPVGFMFTRLEDIITGQPLFDGPRATTSKEIVEWSKHNVANTAIYDDRTKTSFMHVEQLFFKTGRQSLAGQAAWFREDSIREAREPVLGEQGGTVFSNYLNVDINERLTNGAVNPYFMRPYITHYYPRGARIQPQLRDTFRGQLAYELDLRNEKKWTRWFGLHRALGYAEYKKITNQNFRWYTGIVSIHPWLPFGYVQQNPNTRGEITQRFYVGDNVGQNLDYAPAAYKNGQYVLNWRNGVTGNWVADNVIIGDYADRDGNSGNQSILKAQGFTIQSFLLKDRIVTTFGFRKDQTYQRTRPNAAPLPDGRTLDPNAVNAWQTPWVANSGPTRTAGIVVKPFRSNWISFHANKSDNFVPASESRDVYGRVLANPVGEGEDYGLSLNLFGGKFVLKANQYTTKVIGNRTGGFAQNLMDTELITSATNTPWILGNNAAAWITADMAKQGRTLTAAELSEEVRKVAKLEPEWWATFEKYRQADVWAPFAVDDTNNLVAKGKEIELNYNPNSYWTLKLNVTEQETINKDLSGIVEKRIRERLPIWQSIIDTRTGLPWYTTTYVSADGTARNSPENWVNNRMLAGLKLARALEGKSNTQVRKYRVNLSTNFRLARITDQTHLKRLSVGGSLRWEDKGSIGFYGVQQLPERITDLDANRPIWAKSNYFVDLFTSYRTRLFRDKIGTTFQVNVRNLQENGRGGRLQLIKAFPDGSPALYRIIEPRQFIFTATFDL